MRQKLPVIVTYALSIALALTLLLLREEPTRLVIAFLLLLDFGALLALLGRERWDGTAWLGLGLALLGGAFAVLAVALPMDGLAYLSGALLILLAMLLIVVELAAGWRSYAFLERLMHPAKKPVDEQEEEPVQEVLPQERKAYWLLAKQGSTTYHREDCRTLSQTKVAELIQLSEEEAQAYGMEPCKVCKP